MNILKSQPILDFNLLDAKSGAAICWLGQAGFLIEIDGIRFVIDAYLSDSLAIKYAGKKYPHKRMMPVPVEPSALLNIDWILCTHAHTDHMDPGTLPLLLRANSKAKVILPRAEASRAIERGVPADKIVLIDAGETLEVGSVKITAVPSAHEELKCTQDGYLFLGYVLQGAEISLWHSGDTIPWDGQVEWLLPFRVDVALLPVNGRDALRAANGVPGNLNLSEAIALAEDIGAPAMIAHHFGLFEFNTIDIDDAKEELAALEPKLEVRFAELGVSWKVDPKKFRTLSVLIVCKGNICRSPLAEAILSLKLPSAHIDSAAIMNWNEGKAPHSQTQAIARSRGIDLSQLRARQISNSDFECFDVILCMDGENFSALHSLKPTNCRARIGMLGAYIQPGEIFDIPDPWGKDVDVFELVHNQIELACERFARLVVGSNH